MRSCQIHARHRAVRSGRCEALGELSRASVHDRRRDAYRERCREADDPLVHALPCLTILTLFLVARSESKTTVVANDPNVYFARPVAGADKVRNVLRAARCSRVWVPIIRFGRVMPRPVTDAVRAPAVGSRFVIATLSQASSVSRPAPRTSCRIGPTPRAGTRGSARRAGHGGVGDRDRARRRVAGRR